ncbi:unnamed protein product [Rhizophagus irregularis]|nr:unnamed protein product [Rhizophagus irregularis]
MLKIEFRKFTNPGQCSGLRASNGNKVIISEGLDICTANLPQGNDLVGIRCHICEVTQEDLNNTYFDIQLNGRYCHIMDCYYQKIKQAFTKSAKENIAKQHGLCLKKNILDNLIRRDSYWMNDSITSYLLL